VRKSSQNFSRQQKLQIYAMPEAEESLENGFWGLDSTSWMVMAIA